MSVLQGTMKPEIIEINKLIITDQMQDNGFLIQEVRIPLI